MTYQRSNSLRTLTHWQNAKAKIKPTSEILSLINAGIRFAMYFPTTKIDDSALEDCYYIGPWLTTPDSTGSTSSNYAWTQHGYDVIRAAVGVNRAYSPGDSYIYNRYNQTDGYTYHWWIQTAGTYTMQVKPLQVTGEPPYKLHLFSGTTGERLVETNSKTLNCLLPIMHNYYICGAYWSDNDDTSVLPDYMTDLDRAVLDTDLNVVDGQTAGGTATHTILYNAADHTADKLTSAASCDLAAQRLLGQVISDAIYLGDFLADETFEGDFTHLYPWAVAPWSNGPDYNLPLFGGFATANPVTDTEEAAISALETSSKLGGGYTDVSYYSPGWYAGEMGTITELPTSADGVKAASDIYLGDYAYRTNNDYNADSNNLSSGIRSYNPGSGRPSIATQDSIRYAASSGAESGLYIPSYSFKRLTDGACFASMIQICTGYELSKGAQIIE